MSTVLLTISQSLLSLFYLSLSLYFNLSVWTNFRRSTFATPLSFYFSFFLPLSRSITHSFFSYFFLPSPLSLSLSLSLTSLSTFSPFSHRVQSFLSWEVPRSLRSNTKRKSQSFFGHSSFRQRKIIWLPWFDKNLGDVIFWQNVKMTWSKLARVFWVESGPY